MNKPFFYIIQHKHTQKYYFGCKLHNADSSSFMTEEGYQTSSKIIHNIIKLEGLSVFNILKIKHFTDSDLALDYEHRFLQKIDAINNESCYNQTNGSSTFRNKGGYALSESTKKKMRKPKTKETRQKMSQSLKQRDKSVYKKLMKSRRENNEHWNSEKTRKKLSQKNKERFSKPEEIKKHSDTMKQYYKENPVSQKTKDLKKEQNSGSTNPMFGKKHSEKTKEKMRQAWAKRKKEKQT